MKFFYNLVSKFDINGDCIFTKRIDLRRMGIILYVIFKAKTKELISCAVRFSICKSQVFS